MQRKTNMKKKLSEMSTENLETLLKNLERMADKLETGSASPEELLQQDLLAHQNEVQENNLKKW